MFWLYFPWPQSLSLKTVLMKQQDRQRSCGLLSCWSGEFAVIESMRANTRMKSVSKALTDLSLNRNGCAQCEAAGIPCTWPEQRKRYVILVTIADMPVFRSFWIATSVLMNHAEDQQRATSKASNTDCTMQSLCSFIYYHISLQNSYMLLLRH